MRQVRITVLIAATIAASGCGMMSIPSPAQRGNITLAADAEGMHAFSELLVGSMAQAQGKGKSTYWNQREKYEANVTARDARPGFLTSLFSGGAK